MPGISSPLSLPTEAAEVLIDDSVLTLPTQDNLDNIRVYIKELSNVRIDGKSIVYHNDGAGGLIKKDVNPLDE